MSAARKTGCPDLGNKSTNLAFALFSRVLSFLRPTTRLIYVNDQMAPGETRPHRCGSLQLQRRTSVCAEKMHTSSAAKKQTAHTWRNPQPSAVGGGFKFICSSASCTFDYYLLLASLLAIHSASNHLVVDHCVASVLAHSCFQNLLHHDASPLIGIVFDDS